MVPAERWSDDCKCGFVAVIIQNPLNVFFLGINESQSLCASLCALHKLLAHLPAGCLHEYLCSDNEVPCWRHEIEIKACTCTINFHFRAKLTEKTEKAKCLLRWKSHSIERYIELCWDKFGYNESTRHRKKIDIVTCVAFWGNRHMHVSK